MSKTQPVSNPNVKRDIELDELLELLQSVLGQIPYKTILPTDGFNPYPHPSFHVRTLHKRRVGWGLHLEKEGRLRYHIVSDTEGIVSDMRDYTGENVEEGIYTDLPSRLRRLSKESREMADLMDRANRILKDVRLVGNFPVDMEDPFLASQKAIEACPIPEALRWEHFQEGSNKVFLFMASWRWLEKSIHTDWSAVFLGEVQHAVTTNPGFIQRTWNEACYEWESHGLHHDKPLIVQPPSVKFYNEVEGHDRDVLVMETTTPLYCTDVVTKAKFDHKGHFLSREPTKAERHIKFSR
jgi:hypothetical protein